MYSFIKLRIPQAKITAATIPHPDHKTPRHPQWLKEPHPSARRYSLQHRHVTSAKSSHPLLSCRASTLIIAIIRAVSVVLAVVDVLAIVGIVRALVVRGLAVGAVVDDGGDVGGGRRRSGEGEGERDEEEEG